MGAAGGNPKGSAVLMETVSGSKEVSNTSNEVITQFDYDEIRHVSLTIRAEMYDTDDSVWMLVYVGKAIGFAQGLLGKIESTQRGVYVYEFDTLSWKILATDVGPNNSWVHWTATTTAPR